MFGHQSPVLFAHWYSHQRSIASKGSNNNKSLHNALNHENIHLLHHLSYLFWLIPMGVDLVVCISQNLVKYFVVGSGKYHAVLFYVLQVCCGLLRFSCLICSAEDLNKTCLQKNIAKCTTDPGVKFITQVPTQILIKFQLQNLD